MNAFPIIVVAAGATLLLSGGKKKKRRASGAPCPRENLIDLQENNEAFEIVVRDEILSGNKNPFDIMEKALRVLIGEKCSRLDSDSILVPIVNGKRVMSHSKSIPEFYYSGVWSISSKYFTDDLDNIRSKIEKDYKSITGEDIELD